MICPKCQNLMQVVDKEGVHIEQCTECRGIFLDRGELEQIARAEREYYAAQSAPPVYQPEGEPMPPRRQAPPRREYPDSPGYRRRYPDSPSPYGGGYGREQYGHGRKRKRGGFLEDLLDFG